MGKTNFMARFFPRIGFAAQTMVFGPVSLVNSNFGGLTSYRLSSSVREELPLGLAAKTTGADAVD
jgi:hypothetical protein